MPVRAQDRRLSDNITAVATIDPKRPGRPLSTLDVITTARPLLAAQGVGSLAVVAFRHHMPRAAAHVEYAGFQSVIPDVRTVGDFDPQSPWPFIRNKRSWIRREVGALAFFALKGGIV